MFPLCSTFKVTVTGLIRAGHQTEGYVMENVDSLSNFSDWLALNNFWLFVCFL